MTQSFRAYLTEAWRKDEPNITDERLKDIVDFGCSILSEARKTCSTPEQLLAFVERFEEEHFHPYNKALRVQERRQAFKVVSEDSH